MMKTRRASFLIPMILFALSSMLVAQENKEPEHACFRLEDARVFPLEMEVQQSDSNLFRSEFLFMKGWSDKQVFVRIPAMNIPYSILINGFRFGSDPGSGIASEYNITPFINKQSNTLELQAELSAKQNESATIMQGSLLIRDAILTRDLQITTHAGAEENEVLVRFHLFLKSYLTEKNPGRTIQLKVAGQDETKIFHETRELTTPLSFGQETEMIIDLPLKDPAYWLPGAPRYYEVRLSIAEKGEPKPELISSLFDIRSFQLNDSLILNREDSIQLVFPSEELSTILPELPEPELAAIIEELGINAIRRETPLSCTQEELFLRMGILVVLKSE